MAIVVLVLWLFTAGAGFFLLVSSNLGRARPAAVPLAAPPAAQSSEPASVSVPGIPPMAAGASPAPSKREMRRAARERFDPPSLTAAKSAPAIPGLRSLLEFAHPACAIIGLGFWLGYTFVHYRALGWIAAGLVAVTACLGLTWLAANTRAAKSGQDADEPAPSFNGRLVALHGAAATVTVTLAALTALVIQG